MEKLLKGIASFRKKDFSSYKPLFQKLGRSQQPHTLFVGCIDSRVVPNLITNTDPGELLTVRNIANTVPPYCATGKDISMAAVLEYAVQVLAVQNIVVCGHSNCGGCAAMHKSASELDHIPSVKQWLDVSDEVLDLVNRELSNGSPEEREWVTEQTNVVVQMRNLLTYPFVRTRCQTGQLQILGWYYNIETGEVFNYNRDAEIFELVGSNEERN